MSEFTYRALFNLAGLLLNLAVALLLYSAHPFLAGACCGVALWCFADFVRSIS